MIKTILCAVSLCAVTAVAQTVVSKSITTQYTLAKNNIVRAAEKMPEENYSYQPTPDVRTFGQLVGHVANAQYLFCGAASGEQMSAGADVEKTVTGKAALVSALKKAFEACDKIYDGMTDAKGAEMAKFFGREQPRMGILAFNNMHNMEHYGNIVTYMRLKGLVPPSSEPPPAKKGD